MKIKISIGLSTLLLTGCGVAPIPTVHQQEQTIRSIHTAQSSQIDKLRMQINQSNIEGLYLMVDPNYAGNMSGAGAGELPSNVIILLKSILADFGKKVHVIDAETYDYCISNPVSAKNTYIVSGAITMYDKDIMSQSSSFNFGVDFGGGRGKGNGDSDFKDKDKLTALGVDFYLLYKGVITKKTSSKIDIRSTTRGYNFGVSINNGGIGMSGYKTIKDGVGLSVRKLLQSSMSNLISQIINKN